MADRVLVRMRMLLQELVSGEHHAGSTIAALQRGVCNKRLLDGMQATAGRKPLDRGAYAQRWPASHPAGVCCIPRAAVRLLYSRHGALRLPALARASSS